MDTVYIIGNGPSRKGLDLDTLDGTIFGCNALYRDYPSDYLVSGDSTIIKEICESDYPKEHKNYMPPQVLTNVNHEMKFMMEETFGPCVGIMPVENDKEGINLMNDSPYGLTASIWTKDIEAAQKCYHGN